MAITGDRYVATYEGHTIELVRDNWVKTLKLLIDGREVASESRVLPHEITLTGTFEHNGVEHTVAAKSVVHFPSATDTIEVDGQALNLTKIE
jgi:chorismate-pyruvate lyase